MKDLVEKLNYYTKLYDEGRPEVSDSYWDSLYFRLQELERETGVVLANSPTHHIDYQVVSKLNKVKHNHPMLSLAKTKDINEIYNFINGKEVCVMSKLDGLTCSLRYINGELVSAETRGNGIEGEDILHNIKFVKGVPLTIPIKDEVIVDGEVLCTYKDFEPFSSEYANPRNFASGSIRLLDAKESAARSLTFVAWDCIKGINSSSLTENLVELSYVGFTIVPLRFLVDDATIDEIQLIIDKVQKINEEMSYPTDGLVFKYDDIQYYNSLGSTSHHFRGGIALKLYDEEYETYLKDIEWGMGRDGSLTPVAIFEPVDDGDSIIERASLHNVSIMEEILGTNPYKDEPIVIFKANQIIPQVKSGTKQKAPAHPLKIPNICPVCGGKVEIRSEINTKKLYCINPLCSGKFINQLDHFVSKKGLDIKGLSETTLQKLVDFGWIDKISDIFTLKEHRDEWIKKPGFGEKSVDNILAAIEAAKTTTLEAFISAIGIPLVGMNMAKDLAKHINTYEDFRQKVNEKFDFSSFNGFAESKTANILKFDYTNADLAYTYLNIVKPTQENNEKETDKKLSGMKIVITGSLTKFKNRDEIQKIIEAEGGHVINSVSKNTTLLINNNPNGTSSKNLTAKKLNVPIVSEEEFLEKYLH